MKIKTKPFKVDPENPFANDILNRRESAEILTELIKSLDEPFVLAIDAGWGRGKTTFIEQWSAMLQQEGFHTLKFNAWENDFANDPLISFIGEMSSGLALSESAEGEQVAYAEKLDQAKTIGIKILKRSLPTAAKIFTAGVIDFNDFNEAAMANAVSNIVEDQIENYAADKDALAEFRETLEEFVTLITEADKEDAKPLVFFIDELDRCRPTYSIELLERLKHLFNVPGITFVLAMDKEQIGHSICAMYGDRFDATGYLRRFIDLDYRLPSPTSQEFVNYLMREHGFNDYYSARAGYGIDRTGLVKIFTHVTSMFDLGLRDQRQLFSKLSLVFMASPPRANLFIPALLFLMALKHVKPTEYNSIVNREVTAERILNLVPDNSAGKNFLSGDYGDYFNALVMHGFDDEEEIMRKINSQDSQGLERTEATRGERESRALLMIMDAGSAPLIPYLVRKIEISDRFTS